MSEQYRWNGRQTDSQGWSRDRDGKAIEPLRGSRKVGGNKGVMAARRSEKRADAERRNEKAQPVAREGCYHRHGFGSQYARQVCGVAA